MGTLFIVATPIGNLNDMTARALEVLRQADRIACEDTRQTLKLLSHFGIQKQLTSYHDFNEEEKAEELAGSLAAGRSIALVCDSGTPAISDPGYRLVRLCRQRGIPVIAVPGPNAAVTALSASGLPSGEFMFAGFLPSRKGQRRDKITTLANVPSTLIFYEAPHRIQDTLADMLELLGDREVCIAREITKVHEEYVFGTLSAVIDRVNPRGEFVIVLAGAHEVRQVAPPASREEVLKRLGMTRNELYNLFFKK